LVLIFTMAVTPKLCYPPDIFAENAALSIELMYNG
jgi:hypothetical protein